MLLARPELDTIIHAVLFTDQDITIHELVILRCWLHLSSFNRSARVLVIELVFQSFFVVIIRQLVEGRVKTATMFIPWVSNANRTLNCGLCGMV